MEREQQTPLVAQLLIQDGILSEILSQTNLDQSLTLEIRDYSVRLMYRGKCVLTITDLSNGNFEFGVDQEWMNESDSAKNMVASLPGIVSDKESAGLWINEIPYFKDQIDIRLSRDDEQKDENNLIERLKAKKGLLGALGGFLALALKLKSVLILLKLGKFLSTILSMLFMVVVYARLFGAVFGLGFVFLLLIHEIGHYLSAKIAKLDVSLPIFIPFVGAFIKMKEIPQNVTIEAKVALGGPLLGSIGAFCFFLLYFPFHHEVFLAIAYTGFMLNLFNLIPLHPLDGGRIVSAISPKIWFLGVLLGGFMLYKYFNPFIILFIVLGIKQLLDHYRNPNKEYYEVKPSFRFAIIVIYFSLIVSLGIGMTYIHGIHADYLAY